MEEEIIVETMFRPYTVVVEAYKEDEFYYVKVYKGDKYKYWEWLPILKKPIIEDEFPLSVDIKETVTTLITTYERADRGLKELAVWDGLIKYENQFEMENVDLEPNIYILGEKVGG